MVSTARRFTTVLLLLAATLGTGGCLLVPAPVPIGGPVIVAPRPYGYYGGGHYRHGHYGRGYYGSPYGHWRR